VTRIAPQDHTPVIPEPRRAFRKADVDQAFEDQRGRCALCPRMLGHTFVRDHILPRDLSGETNRANLQLLCPACDQKKTAADRERIDKSRRIRKREAGETVTRHPIRSRGFQTNLTRGFDGKVRERT
jgi:5-methylcytosine-specific restriction endonuclease McrA